MFDKPSRLRQSVITMGYVITLAAPREVTLVEYPEPELAPNQVRLRTLYSGISAGTDRPMLAEGALFYLNLLFFSQIAQQVMNKQSFARRMISHF